MTFDGGVPHQMKIGGVSLRESHITLTTLRDTILSFLSTIKVSLSNNTSYLARNVAIVPSIGF